jgi:hypothetical protein
MKLDETVPSGTLERENDRKQEAASIFMKRLDEDRRIVGMQPAELWRILETKGIAELRAELDRRLTKSSLGIKRGVNQPLASAPLNPAQMLNSVTSRSRRHE